MPFPVSPNPGDSYTDAYGTVWIYAGSVNGWYRQTVIPGNETSYTAGLITTDKIIDNTIINADVASNAAIAGTKISPNFGSQNVTTTGTSTAASFIPTSSTVPTNGVYLPAANSVAISTNGTGRLFVDASGNVGINNAADPTSILKITQLSDATSGGIQLVSVDGNGAVISRLNDGGLTFRNGGFERLRITSAGLVGIGTSSPDSALHISTSSAANLAKFTRTVNEGIYVHFSRPNKSYIAALDINNNGGKDFTLYDATAAASRITVTDGGSVGIGTTSPGATLDVNGNIRISSVVGLEIASSSNSTITHKSGGSSTAYYTYLDASRNYIWQDSATERMRIDSSGRLLVGTSTSRTGYSLQVEGTSDATGSSSIIRNSNDSLGGALDFGKSRGTTLNSNTVVIAGDRLGSLRFKGTDGSALLTGALIEAKVDGTPGTNDLPTRLEFSTTADGASSPTERMRISQAGNVFINTQSALINESQISATGSGNTACLKTTVSSNNPLLLWNSATSGDNIFCSFFTESSYTARATIDYNRGAGQVRYNTTSDRRLKSDITPAPTALSKLNEIEVKSYKWTETDYLVEYGFIAQELNVVLPDAVKQGDDEDEVVDAWAVDNSKLVPLLTKALQEAVAKIESLEARLTAAGI